MIRAMRWMPAAVLAAGLTVASAGALAGQRMPPMRGGPPGQNRQELEERVRARFGEIIRQRLGLDEETARALDDAVEAFRQDRQKLGREQEALRKRVEAFALEGGGSNTEAKQLLARMDELRAEEDRLYKAEQDTLSTVLTPSQLLRFNVMREQMAQRIQQLRMGGMRGRGPGRGGGRSDGGRPDDRGPGGPGGKGGVGPGGDGAAVGWDLPAPGGGHAWRWR